MGSGQRRDSRPQSSEHLHFDAISEFYYQIVDKLPYDVGYFHQEELSFVLDALAGDSTTPLRVLDAGSGPGRYSAHLAEIGHEVVALDFSVQMVRQSMHIAREAGLSSRITFVNGNVRHLPFPDNSFDFIICLEVLEHLPQHVDDASLALAEFGRVLRDKGGLIVEVPLASYHEVVAGHDDFRPSWKEITPDEWEIYEKNPLETDHFFEEDVLDRLLAEHGFAVETKRHVRVIPAGLIEKYPFLEYFDRILEEHPESRRLAREVLWLAHKEKTSKSSDGIASSWSHSSLSPVPETTRGLIRTLTMLQASVSRREQDIETISARVAEREQVIQSLSAQIAEDERTMQSLSGQMTEREQIVQSLSAQVAEREQVIQSLSAQIAEDERTMQSLSEQVAERERVIQSLSAQVAEHAAAIERQSLELANRAGMIEALSSQLEKRDKTTRSLSVLLAEKEQAEQSLVGQLNEYAAAMQSADEERDELNTRLHTVFSTKAWRTIATYWRIRDGLAAAAIRLGRAPIHLVRALYQGTIATYRRIRVGLASATVAFSRASIRLVRAIYRWIVHGATGLPLWIVRLRPAREISLEAAAFETYKRARESFLETDLSGLRCPSEDGLVSIVLPVYNGAPLVPEALDSILAQTYENFELIAINDGSTDTSGDILDEYAREDSRIRVVHQENRKIPASLSRGFQMARGEFLTWTSADNRLKPVFLERMVACLRRNPAWDMAYANLDIIGDDGSPLRASDWYRGYQQPPGSEHIYLPGDALELNIVPNNYVGAAFLYRDRAAYLIGDYSSIRFTTEDYDYWMKINSLLHLRHADFADPVYEYRFHPNSLTAQDEELGITKGRVKLMVFDDFRRDFFLCPMVWLVEEAGSHSKSRRAARALTKEIAAAGHNLCEVGSPECSSLPRLWVPAVYVHVTDHPTTTQLPPDDLPPGSLRALIAVSDEGLPEEMATEWDVCVAIGDQPAPPRLTNDYQGWLAAPKMREVFSALDIRTRTNHLVAIEAEIARQPPPKLGMSVIICTHQPSDRLARTVASVAEQTFPERDYEVIVVSNDPQNADLSHQITGLGSKHFADRQGHFRHVNCPLRGLSFARNAGLSEARGEIVCYLDDDAIATTDWLERIWEAFQQNPDVGALGGHILLEVPDPRPPALEPGWEPYWSHFVTDYSQVTRVSHWSKFPWGANWSARREVLLEAGGFRARFGRRGDDFWGGEELVIASVIRQLGHEVAVAPLAIVKHDVQPRRFTLQHVRRTIRAATLVNYIAQLNLYVPFVSVIEKTHEDVVRAILDEELNATSHRGRINERRFHRAALIHLFVFQLRETLHRKPGVNFR